VVKWVKYNTNYFFYLYPFAGSHLQATGQTSRWIFTFDNSNDADSRKDVGYGVSSILTPVNNSRPASNAEVI